MNKNKSNKQTSDKNKLNKLDKLNKNKLIITITLNKRRKSALDFLTNHGQKDASNEISKAIFSLLERLSLTMESLKRR